MDRTGNFNHDDEEALFPSLYQEDANEFRKTGFNLDYEIMIKKAFETDTNQGIELLFRYYYRPLCSHAVRYVSSKEVAEDIVSDIFYKFHAEQIFAQVQGSYRAYLFTSVRYRAFDYVKADLKRNASIQYAEYVPIQTDQQPDYITQYEDLYNDVENAVNSLPPKRRRIYVMHRFEGKKFKEIALELNLSLRTVEAQMYQALHQVRNLLREKWFFIFLVFIV